MGLILNRPSTTQLLTTSWSLLILGLLEKASENQAEESRERRDHDQGQRQQPINNKVELELFQVLPP